MRLRRATALAAAVLALTGCASFVGGMASSARTAAASGGSGDATGCPAGRGRPDPDRPVVAYDFRLSDDQRTVTGTETVTFVPDLVTDRLVFRLLPNDPRSARAGNGLTVDAVRGGDVAGGGYLQNGAAGPGGLYQVRLHAPLEAGDATEVEWTSH